MKLLSILLGSKSMRRTYSIATVYPFTCGTGIGSSGAYLSQKTRLFEHKTMLK